jgi:hypothetical protein
MVSMSTTSQYDMTGNVLLGLYSVDDPTDALDAVFAVSLFTGTAVTDASAWFPKWRDELPSLCLASDAYSLSAARTLLTQLESLVPVDGASELEAASKAVDSSDAPIRLGFARTTTPLVHCSILAAIVGDPVDGDGSALVAVGRSGGELIHLLRFRTGGPVEERPLSTHLDDLARRMTRFVCGVSAPGAASDA